MRTFKIKVEKTYKKKILVSKTTCYKTGRHKGYVYRLNE